MLKIDMGESAREHVELDLRGKEEDDEENQPADRRTGAHAGQKQTD